MTIVNIFLKKKDFETSLVQCKNKSSLEIIFGWPYFKITYMKVASFANDTFLFLSPMIRI